MTMFGYETSSNEDTDKEDLTPLTFKLIKDSEGYLINNKVYLTEFQWNTMVYDSNNDTIYCALCDKLITIPDMCDDHMSSVKHKLNLKKHKPLNNYPDSFIRLIRKQYHCGFCNRLFDKEDKDDHLGSRVHDITKDFARKKVTDKIQIKKVHKIGKYTFKMDENDTAKIESDDSWDVYFDEKRQCQSNCNGSVTTVSDEKESVNYDTSANDDSVNVVMGADTDMADRDITVASSCGDSDSGHGITSSGNDIVSNGSDVESSDDDIADSGNDDVSSNTDVVNSDSIVAVNSNDNSKSGNLVVLDGSNKVKKSGKSHDITRNDKNIVDESNNVQTVRQTGTSDENKSCKIKPNRKFVVTKPKNFIQDFLMIEYKDKKMGLHFHSWHMLIKNSMGSLYCAICKLVLPPNEVTSHCEETKHLEKLMSITVMEEFSEYFVRRFDSSFYHCSHCNSMIDQYKMESHLLMEHSKNGMEQIEDEQKHKYTIKNAGNIDNQQNADFYDQNQEVKDLDGQRKKKPSTLLENNNQTDQNINSQYYNIGGHNQPNYNVGGQNQPNFIPGYNQPTYNVGGQNQPNYFPGNNQPIGGQNQPNFIPGYNQPIYNVGGQNQPNYIPGNNQPIGGQNQPNFIPGYNQSTYNVGGQNQPNFIPGYNQPTYNVAGQNPPNFIPGYNQPNYNVASQNQPNFIPGYNPPNYKTNHIYGYNQTHYNMSDPNHIASSANNHQAWSPELRYEQMIGDIMVYKFGFLFKLKYLAYNVICRTLNKYFCGLCNQTVADEMALFSHVLSPYHRYCVEKTPYVVEFGLHLIRHIRGVFHCTLCNVPVNTYAIFDHTTSELHAAHLAAALGIPAERTAPPATLLSPFILRTGAPSRPLLPIPRVSFVHLNGVIDPTRVQNPCAPSFIKTPDSGACFGDQTPSVVPNFERNSNASNPAQSYNVEPNELHNNLTPNATMPQCQAGNVANTAVDHLAKILLDAHRNCDPAQNETRSQQSFVINDPLAQFKKDDGSENPVQGPVSHESQHANEMKRENLDQDILKYTQNNAVGQNIALTKNCLLLNETIPQINTEVGAHNTIGSEDFEIKNVNDTIAYGKVGLDVLDHIKNCDIAQDSKSVENNLTSHETVPKKNIKADGQEMSGPKSYKPYNINDTIANENLALNLLVQIKSSNDTECATSEQNNSTLSEKTSPRNIDVGVQNTLDSDRYYLHGILNACEPVNLSDRLKNCNTAQNCTLIQHDDLILDETTPEKIVKHGTQNTLDSGQL